LAGSSQDDKERAQLDQAINDLWVSLKDAGNLFVMKDGDGDMGFVEVPATIDYEAQLLEAKKAHELSEEMKQRLQKEAEKSQDEQLRALTRNIKEVVVVDAEQPKELSSDEAQQDPIKAAGQELVVEASHWDASDNPIVVVVNTIAQKFIALAAHHNDLPDIKTRAKAKKLFIQTAQEIVSEASKLGTQIEPLVRHCSDKRLVQQIQSTTKSITTLSQQLKILVAVKASNPHDVDRGSQLVSNGKNLVHGVKMVLRDAISCTLRLRKDAPGDMFKFRKVIYAKGIQTE
jgi:hypothetical protein